MSEVLTESTLRPGLLAERRLARMRLGQAVFEIFPLPSDSEIRIALVPLNEADHENAMTSAALIDVPDNLAGNQLRDRRETLEILAFAIRDPKDTTKRIYNTGTEVGIDLEPTDVGFLIDHYYELAATNSPSVAALSAEDQATLKKALQEMDWNELSGQQWYAATRFLSSLMQGPLAASLLGLGSTLKSTTTSGLGKSIPTA